MSTNQKLLEEIQERKKALMMKGTGNRATGSSSSTSLAPTTIRWQQPDARAVQLIQKAEADGDACQYVPTNSTFGNLILPVMPRFDDEQKK